MRFVIDKEETAFFQSHGWLELETEPFLPLLQSITSWVEMAMDRAIFKARVNVWDMGRDLWRQEKNLAQFVQNPLWSQIFSVLSQKKPLRLGLDAYFRTEVPGANMEEVLLPLEEKHSIQGFLGGVLFALKPHLRIFFLEANRTIHNLQDFFFMPETEEETMPQLYYFLGLTSAVSQYRPLSQDPFRDWLKALGIVVGGVLSDKTHPILYR